MKFYNIAEQKTLFLNCSLNMDKFKIKWPGDVLMNKVEFDARFPDSVFALDKAHVRTTRSAFIAYTRNKEYRPLVYWWDDKPTVGSRTA